MGVSIDIGEVNVLAEPACVVGQGGDVCKESAQGTLAAVRERYSTRPSSGAYAAIEASRPGKAAVVQERAVRIVIGVHRHQRSQGLSIADARAGRILVQPVHVKIEPRAIRAVALAAYSPQCMSPAIVCAVISEAFALRVHRKARRPFAREGNGRSKIEAKGAVTSSANGQRFVLCSGILVHDMDDADKRSGDIGDLSGSAHHFSTFGVILE